MMRASVFYMAGKFSSSAKYLMFYQLAAVAITVVALRTHFLLHLAVGIFGAITSVVPDWLLLS